MKKIADGWHVIAGFDVYVENGQIIRGIKYDQNGQRVTAWVYRINRAGVWTIEEKITPDAFRAGVKRGTVNLL